MQIERFPIDGVLLITPTKRLDPRGFFSEVYRSDVFAAEGIAAAFVQDNHVFSHPRGVLRGMHFQIPPHAQGKLVRCIKGSILDVAVDIRRGSPTFGRHVAAELSASNFRQLWVPPGFAHGFVVLSESAQFLYKTTDYWYPEHERSIVWNDPEIGIEWPIDSEPLLAAKDAAGKRLAEAEHFA